MRAATRGTLIRVQHTDGKDLTVLVVDDDCDARSVVETVLRDDGIRVVGVADPVDALLMLQARHFDLLLTDIRMPAMDGLELARRTRELRPALRVLFLSAYAKELGIDPAREAWVMKPFRSHELLGCIYETLSRNTGESHPPIR
jgi:CheY-like chemotaxis protein